MTEFADIRSGSITSGVRWTAAAQSLRVVLQFGVSIALARLLEPSDFGLLAMASAVTGMASTLQSLGMHGPIVQRERLPGTLIDTVFLTNLVLSAAMTAVLIAVAPWVAALYRDGAVEPIIRVLALTLFMYALGGVPGALLRRRMEFQVLAKVAVAAALLQSAVALALAANGFGVWSLVSAMLVAATVESLLTLAAARYWPRLRFSRAELRSIAGFSANMTGVNLLNLVAGQADKVVIGRWLGAEALGFYGMSLRFTRQPVTLFVRPILGRVLFPAYARMQDDDRTTAAMMRRAIAGVSLIMFPVLAGFATVAEPFVTGLLGPKWAPAVILIYFLAPVGMLHALLVTVSSVFVARDRTGLFLILRVAYAGALIAAYALGLRWGLTGVVACILVAEAAVVLVELLLCARQVRMGLPALLAGCGRVLVATAIMAASVMFVRWGLAAAGAPDLVQLGAAVATGAMVYVLAVLALRIPAVADLARLLPGPARRLVDRLSTAV